LKIDLQRKFLDFFKTLDADLAGHSITQLDPALKVDCSWI